MNNVKIHENLGDGRAVPSDSIGSLTHVKTHVKPMHRHSTMLPSVGQGSKRSANWDDPRTSVSLHEFASRKPKHLPKRPVALGRPRFLLRYFYM